MGIAWRGNRYPDGDGFRPFRLDALRTLAALPGVRLISLQLKEGKEELDKLRVGMHVEVPGSDFDAGPDGFLDSAAVLAVMDLVISCDTAMAHLPGALGRPLWIALNRTKGDQELQKVNRCSPPVTCSRPNSCRYLRHNSESL